MWRYSIGGLKWQAYFELNVWLPSPKDTNTDVPFRSVWHLLLPQPLLWPCIINLRRRWSDSLLNETIQQLRCNWAVTWSWTEVPWTPRSSLDTFHGASFGLFFNPENMDNWEHLKKTTERSLGNYLIQLQSPKSWLILTFHPLLQLLDCSVPLTHSPGDGSTQLWVACSILGLLCWLERPFWSNGSNEKG